MTKKINYRPEIDGLRAIAVFSVILHHLGVPGIHGGFFGVDVFFVISGYLITRICLFDSALKKYSLLTFYERRIRRIIPMLLVVLFVAFCLSWISLTPFKFEQFGKSLIGVLTFSSNFIFWSESGYFDINADLKPLLHTWSLAVEEQFYILFPVLLWLMTKTSKKSLQWTLGLIFFISFALSDRLSWTDSSGNFYLLPSRIWELLTGCILARMELNNGRSNSNSKISVWLLGLGVASLISALVLLNNEVRHPGPWTLIPVGATSLIIWYGDGKNWISKILSSKILVGAGLISYSLYLWHQPLLAYIRISKWNFLFESQKMILIIVIIGISYLSWKFIENPFRNPQIISNSKFYKIILTSSSVLFIMALGSQFTNGFASWRFTDRKLSLLDYSEYPGAKFMSEGRCMVPFNFDSSKYDIDQCRKLFGSKISSNWIIWGDSFAAALFPGISKAIHQDQFIQMTASGCAPIFNFSQPQLPKCITINERFFSLIPREAPVKILLVGNWVRYIWIKNFDVALTQTLQRLKKENFEIFVVGLLPEWEPSLPEQMVEYMKNLNLAPEYLPTSQLTKLEEIDENIKNICAKENVKFFSILSKTCQGSKCRANLAKPDAVQPLLVAWDYGHPTSEGSDYYGKLIKEFLNKKYP